MDKRIDKNKLERIEINLKKVLEDIPDKNELGYDLASILGKVKMMIEDRERASK